MLSFASVTFVSSLKSDLRSSQHSLPLLYNWACLMLKARWTKKMHCLPGGSGSKEVCIHSLTNPYPEKFRGERGNWDCFLPDCTSKHWAVGRKKRWSLYKVEMLMGTAWLRGISNHRLAQNLKVTPNQQNWKSLWYHRLQSLQGSHEKSLRGDSGK